MVSVLLIADFNKLLCKSPHDISTKGLIRCFGAKSLIVNMFHSHDISYTRPIL